jgi:hypothetical protein
MYNLCYQFTNLYEVPYDWLGDQIQIHVSVKYESTPRDAKELHEDRTSLFSTEVNRFGIYIIEQPDW